MNVSEELLSKINAEVDLIEPLYENFLTSAIIFDQSTVEAVIERIPEAIARAVMTEHNFAVVGEIFNINAVASTRGFDEEPLYYSVPNRWQWIKSPKRAEKHIRLIGAAAKIFEYCKTNGLRPKLVPAHQAPAETDGRKAIWEGRFLIIRWNPKSLARALNRKPYGSFDINAWIGI